MTPATDRITGKDVAASLQGQLGLETPLQLVALWQEVLAELDARQTIVGVWIFEIMLYGCCYRAWQQVVQRSRHPVPMNPKQAGDIIWDVIMRRSTQQGIATRTHQGRLWFDLAAVRALVLELRDEAQAVRGSGRMEPGPATL